MPELPEVETVRRGLTPVMRGARIDKVELRRADIRFPFPDSFAETADGPSHRRDRPSRQIPPVRAGQWRNSDRASGHVRARSGWKRLRFRRPASSITNVRRTQSTTTSSFVLDNGWVVTYNDPRRFGFMDLGSTGALDQHPRMRGLGAEPLAPEFDGHSLAELFAGSRTSLKAGLLDQRRIAGLGNIYVSEALFRARLSPSKPAGILANARGGPTKAAVAVAKAIRDVLEEAVEAGGSTLRDHRQANGELGYFQHTFKVYDREGSPCARNSCRGTVARITQAGRSTFYCSKCQH